MPDNVNAKANWGLNEQERKIKQPFSFLMFQKLHVTSATTSLVDDQPE